MARRFMALIVLLLVGPAIAMTDGHPAVQDLVRDIIVRPSIADFEFVGGCGLDGVGSSNGNFQVDVPNGSFLFSESPFTNGILTGEAQTACGWANLDVVLPEGTNHLHVRFDADRRLADRTQGQEPPNAHQELLAMANDAIIYEQPFYAPDGLSYGTTAHDPPAISLPGLEELVLSWYFSDDGAALQQGTINVASAHGLSSQVSNISLEFSGVPLRYTEAYSQQRQGSLIVDNVEGRFTLDAAAMQEPAHVRIRYDPLLEPEAIYLPNGVVLSEFDTGARTTHLPIDYVGRPLVEQGQTQWQQLVLPWSFMENAGEGDYKIVLRAVTDSQPSTSLLLVNVFLLLVPILFAARAIVGTSTFYRESFGRFRQSAKALIVAVALVLAYYLVVLVATWRYGALERLSVLPLTSEAWFVYSQIIMAIVAFVGLAKVGRRLSDITRPA